jgi:hypothetical protein
MEYEQQGFFGNIVSTNGFVAEDDQFTIYYGVFKASLCVEPMKEKREGIGGKYPTLFREEERIMHTRFSCAQPILLQIHGQSVLRTWCERERTSSESTALNVQGALWKVHIFQIQRAYL